MPRGRRTDKVTAATAMVLSETLGHSERQIGKELELPNTTVHTILSKANGWAEIAEEPVFKRNRAMQNKALEQAARWMAAKAMEKAEGKMDQAGFYHLALGAGIMIDKARLLAGEPTEITLQVQASASLDWLADKLQQRLMKNEIDVTPSPTSSRGNPEQ